MDLDLGFRLGVRAEIVIVNERESLHLRSDLKRSNDHGMAEGSCDDGVGVWRMPGIQRRRDFAPSESGRCVRFARRPAKNGRRTSAVRRGHYGRASATYSLGMSSQPTVTTMYCFPSTM